ncbi:MAG: hypothetical protein M1826_000825 [Phylliscum demangeonii]|nr:MAG: hypothetical protein M1826_000825 [Phylliscum demangeonii]
MAQLIIGQAERVTVVAAIAVVVSHFARPRLVSIVMKPRLDQTSMLSMIATICTPSYLNFHYDGLSKATAQESDHASSREARTGRWPAMSSAAHPTDTRE